jgi:hypothetical protein
VSGEEAGGLAGWRELPPRERWQWFQQRWHEAIELSDRYRLALRSGWWEDALRVEALAAFAAWVAMYDTEVAIDPAGKLQLLSQLDWLRQALRGGEQAFNPPADRAAFDQYLVSIGCHPPHGHQPDERHPDPELRRRRRELETELTAIEDRLRELSDRERALHSELDSDSASRDHHARRDLAELERAIPRLRHRTRELRHQLDHSTDQSQAD